MDLSLPTRIGKIAMLAAMSDPEEEAAIKATVAARGDIRLAITFISGLTIKIHSSYAKSVLNAALQAEVIKKNSAQIHALLHASLEAFQGLTPKTAVATSLKMKIAIVADSKWLAVAAYGDSAFTPITNHERAGLGVMHL